MHIDFNRPYGSIYVALNKVNGKCYVGQTTQDADVRFEQHRRRVQSSHCLALSSAIRHHGQNAFEFFVACTSFSREALDQAESELIIAYDSVAPNGYNIKFGGANGKHSMGTRAKMSAAHTGKKLAPAHVEKLRRRMIGMSPSQEVRAKIAAALNGRAMLPQTRAALLAANTGRVPSAEARKKMSQNRSGIPVSEEKKSLLREANLGKKHTLETRRKMVASQRIRWAARKAAAIKCR